MLKRFIPVFLSFVFLAASIVYVGQTQQKEAVQTVADASPAQITEKPAEELRGVWVTYMTLDIENESDKEAAFEEKLDTIISDMQKMNLNTMIVQVRPFSDALYPSRYYPWSHILTGTQGENPGFDPLKTVVEKAHKNDIAVHAWVNPYRISTKETPSSLSADNPYSLDPSIGVEVNGNLYLNPASEKARELIADGAAEIAKNYHVDAIQFDDYFYPPDCGDFDADDYEAYCESTDSPLSLENFRFENVNQMVKLVYQRIHQANRDTLFGISPQGNLSNNDELYADVALWCREEGYIDYIAPQIYFSLDNPALTFEDSFAQWLKLEKHPDLALYIGIPAYKAGSEADEGTWLDNSDILETELSIVREKSADGFMLYSYDSLKSDDGAEEIENVLRYLNQSEVSSPTQ